MCLQRQSNRVVSRIRLKQRVQALIGRRPTSDDPCLVRRWSPIEPLFDDEAGEKRGPWRCSDLTGVARPRPRLWSIDKSSSDRIQRKIARDLAPVAAVFENPIEESPAKQVPMPTLSCVRSLCEPSVDPSHSLRESRRARAENQVIVRAHQTPRAAVELVASARSRDDLDEVLAVLVVEHDRAVVVSTGADVVNGAGVVDAERSGHDRDAA